MGDAEPPIHPAHVHAFERTGILVTEHNEHLFTEDELEAWAAAVAEGERLHGPVQDASGWAE